MDGNRGGRCFLVHPIQTEAVLYVYQRSTLLACFFSLLALLALADRRVWWAAMMFFLAFESKESALAVPLAVALFGGGRVLAGSPLPSGEGGRVAAGEGSNAGLRRANPLPGREGFLRIALFLTACTFIAATLGLLAHVNEKTVGIGAAPQVGPLRYLYTETRVVYTYIRLLFFPYPQSLEYDFQNAGGLFSVTGIILMLAAGWLLRRRIPGLCILAFFILLAPTSSIIPSADTAFEHRLYLPMLAFSLLVAYLVSKIPRRTWIAATVLAILAILTLRRETVWSSDAALWEDTARHAPGKARVWFNLGGAYLNTDTDKARAALLRALELQPHFPEALYDLGVIEQGKNNWGMALAYYQRAVGQEPDYWPAWNNMGNTLFAMGQPIRAVENFERTLRLNPDYWPAQYNIAIVHFMSGRYTDAAPKLKIVLDWQPDFREARYLLATSLTLAGDRNAAGEEWKKLGEVHAAESRHTPTMILAPNRP